MHKCLVISRSLPPTSSPSLLSHHHSSPLTSSHPTPSLLSHHHSSPLTHTLYCHSPHLTCTGPNSLPTTISSVHTLTLHNLILDHFSHPHSPLSPHPHSPPLTPSQEYKVDVAFWGHHHSYQRTCPIYKESCTQDGTVHIVIGMGGQGLSKNVQ